MVLLRHKLLPRYLLLSFILALLLFISSFWLPPGEPPDCGSAWRPCSSFHIQTSKPPLLEAWLEPGGSSALIKECPGQSFQAWRLLKYLKSCMADDGDILLESYLQGWDQLLEYADTVTPFQGPPNRSRDLKESALQISQAQIPVSSSGSSAVGTLFGEHKDQTMNHNY